MYMPSAVEESSSKAAGFLVSLGPFYGVLSIGLQFLTTIALEATIDFCAL